MILILYSAKNDVQLTIILLSQILNHRCNPRFVVGSITDHRRLILQALHPSWQELGEVFKESPTIAFRKGTNKLLEEQIIGGNEIQNNKRLVKHKVEIKGKCSPCLSNRCLCCKHLIHTTALRSNQTKLIFSIFLIVKVSM